MIHTVTFNPALDYITEIDNFEVNKINRTRSELILPGGKGINVSIVLKNLGFDSRALGFVAGFTGDELERLVKEFGIKPDFVKLHGGITRINVKVTSNVETAINANGPKIANSDLEELFKKIDEIRDGDILVLSGSIPSFLLDDMYERICLRIQNKDVKIVADATGNLLRNVLKYKPFLIKPNLEELGDMFGIKIESKEIAIEYAKKLLDEGACNVLVSMGGDGAAFVSNMGQTYYLKAPSGQRVNTVGAGDSVVAGFIAGYEFYHDYEKAFKMGVSCRYGKCVL